MISTVDKLREIWADILDLEPDDISDHDSFWSVGGTSVLAIWLVRDAVQEGIPLTVEKIYRHSTLVGLAAAVDGNEQKEEEDEDACQDSPLSLLAPHIDAEAARQEAAKTCNIDISQVEDIFPCSAMQESLLSLAEAHPGGYTMHKVFRINASADLKFLRKAWDACVQNAPLLRTRIIYLSGIGLVHVVLRESAVLDTATGLKTYLDNHKNQPMGLGQPLTRFTLVEDEQTNYLVLVLHHAIYDAWSMNRIKEFLTSTYKNEPARNFLPYQRWISYLQNMDRSRIEAFWKQYFEGTEARTFPQPEEMSHVPAANADFHHNISGLCRPSSCTLATAVKAALAIMIAARTSCDEAIFGAVVSGRQAPLTGVESIAGPTLTTVPMRIKTNWSEPLSTLLKEVQQQVADVTPYEQAGLSLIRQVSQEAKDACKYQTWLIIQPCQDKAADSGELLEQIDDEEIDNAICPYGLTIVCNLYPTEAKCIFKYDSHILEQDEVLQIAHQFEHILRRLVDGANIEQRLSDISLVSPYDIELLEKWNSEAPKAVKGHLADKMEEIMRQNPTRPAVCAWDGSLTYEELDRLTLRLANEIVQRGIGPNDVVTLLFEKSMWAAVARVAVMRAGAVPLVLDVASPRERLAAVMEKADAKVLLVSEEMRSTTTGLLNDATISINQDHMESLKNPQDISFLKRRSATDIAFICFTSGSTGVPKGFLLTHENWASAYESQGHIYGITTQSRVYEFSANHFDGAWHYMLVTFLAGGCLIVPSETERHDDLFGSIERPNATHIAFTPSAARVVEPELLPNVQHVSLWGEVTTAADMARWSAKPQVWQMYGPAECTTFSTFLRYNGHNARRGTIGSTVGVRAWIAHPENPQNLMAVGCVGELWLEGPTVGTGYVGDPERTAKTYFDSPPWLPQVQKLLPHIEPITRAYRSGDLARQCPDGSLEFHGRIDQQVKIRGQRVDLAEFEVHVRSFFEHEEVGLQGLAEVFTPTNGSSPMLVLFLALSGQAPKNTTVASLATGERLQGLTRWLSGKVPEYLVPSVYLPLQQVPKTRTDKVDRRSIAKYASSLTMEEVIEKNLTQNESRQADTAMEKRLQKLWADVLGIKQSIVKSTASFIDVGGDSVSAMRLVNLARKEGIQLASADVLQRQSLQEVAAALSSPGSSSEPQNDVPPFSLLTKDCPYSLRRQIAKLCHLSPSNIVDAFPCTGLQERLFSATVQRQGEVVTQFVRKLDNNVDLARLGVAITDTQKSHEVFRTRIVQLPEHGMIQTIVDVPIACDRCPSLDAFKAESPIGYETLGHVTFGSPLYAFSLIGPEEDGSRHIVITGHHAVYDGWALDLLWKAIESAYEKGHVPDSPPQYQKFIKYLLDEEKDDMAFWKDQLSDVGTECFPTAPTPKRDYNVAFQVQHVMSDIDLSQGTCTPAAAIRTTMALLWSNFAGTSYSLFGDVLHGREIPVPGIAEMTALALSFVPLHIKVDGEKTVQAMLQQITHQMEELATRQKLGERKISAINENAARACEYTTVVCIDPSAPWDATGPVFRERVMTNTRVAASIIPVVVYFFLAEKTVTLAMASDSDVVSNERCQEIARQVEHVLRSLADPQNASVRLRDITLQPPSEAKWVGDEVAAG